MAVYLSESREACMFLSAQIVSSGCIHVYFVVKSEEENLGAIKTGNWSRGDMKIKM